MERWHLIVDVLTLVALLVGLVPTAAAQSGPASDTWGYLGPAGPKLTMGLAVAPGWPADRLLLAVRQDQTALSVVRSWDGGATWESSSSVPSTGIAQLALAPAAGGQRAVFLVARQEGPDRQPGQTLYYSHDAGASWQPALSLASAGEPELTLSPNFAQDGLALLVEDGQLFRSRDGGTVWEEWQPVPEQRIQRVRFSPEFARDRTLFLAVTSGGFPDLLLDQPSDQPASDHEQSLGVVVSIDAGESWTVISTGLEVDGLPYRHVQQLAVSPTFGVDNTLFAFAWGPRVPTVEQGWPVYRDLQSALFRSDDRGASWVPVRLGRGHVFARLALSPAFADDRVALLAESSGGFSPASNGCEVLRTDNGGAGWSSVLARGSYQYCAEVLLTGSGGNLTAVVERPPDWQRSLDGGLTWQQFNLPLGGVPAVVVPSPAAARDRTVLVGALGVWTYGPTAHSTMGHLPCAATAKLGFGRIWSTEAWAAAQLGCPLEPERPVRIREGRSGDQRGYWLENNEPLFAGPAVPHVPCVPPGPCVVPSPVITAGSPGPSVPPTLPPFTAAPEAAGPIWPELLASDYACQALSWCTWTAHSSADKPWPDATYQVLNGAMQHFEGGTMLWLPYSEGRRVVLVLASMGEIRTWREFPD